MKVELRESNLLTIYGAMILRRTLPDTKLPKTIGM